MAMAKSNPVHLDKALMDAAILAAGLNSRSAAQQLESWANLGKLVSEFTSVEALLSVVSSCHRIELVPIDNPSIDVDALFNEVSVANETSSLKMWVSGGGVRYQASDSPG